MIIGRFLSNDPVGFGVDQPQMFNRYAYTYNNPVNANNPDGEFINFVAKFLVDVAIESAIQYATTGSVDVGSAVTAAAIGLVNPAKTLERAKDLAKVVNKVGDARKAAKACCFVAGTLVESEDGLRPIEDIEIGDKVWARNEETGETALKAVTDMIRRHERVIWEVVLAGPEAEAERFKTTDDHPWWIAGQGWKETEQLAAGMAVVTRDGRGMVIASVIETDRTDATYNLTVADFETYFVGEQRVLVHKCDLKNLKSSSQVGDRVKTPDNSPDDFTRLKGGQGDKDNKTGTIFQRSNTNHSQSPGGEFKAGTKPGQQKWPQKFGQGNKWILGLRLARLPRQETEP